MPAELSITDGVASFADSRTRNGQVDAWHRLGTPVGHVMTAEEALNAAHLAGWNVRKVPVLADLRKEDAASLNGVNWTGRLPVVGGQFATIFDNPVNGRITPIGVVGNRYTPIQNEEMTEFCNALVDQSGAHYETAGSLRGYTQTFITMKMPQTMVLTGVDGQRDTTEWYVALFTSHDGSTSMFGIITDVRVVCANTAGIAIAGAKSKFSVPHTSGWAGAVQKARESLGLAFEYREAFEAEVRGLFAQPFSVSDMQEFSNELVELSKAERDTAAFTRRQNEANSIVKLFVESPTIVGTPVAGTAYGAFNAVTEYVDHVASIRGGGDNTARQEKLRATRTLLLATTGGGLKGDAWKLLRN